MKFFTLQLVKVFLPVLLIFLCADGISQTTYDWQNSSPDGNWRQGAASGPRWNPGGLWDEPPSSSNTILRFDNNTFNAMTNNAAAGYIIQRIIFGSGNTISRSIGGNAVQFFEFGATWPRIQNDANAVLHSIGFPISASTNTGFNLELLANAGPLEFIGPINNNGRTIQIYGNNAAIDGTNRYIRLSGVLSGAGVLNVSQFGVAKLNAAHVYTGQTQIDNGELWIEGAAGIAAGSGIFIGNGGQLTNVTKLWLSNATGGTTVANNLTINNGNANTRYLGGLNSSGTHTFSGDIANNSTIGGLNLSALTAGGTTILSGIISGANAVTTEGAGTLILSGGAANTYAGGTTAKGALLVLNKVADTKAVGGSLTISTGATVRTDAQNQLGTGTPSLVTLNGTGIFNGNGFNQKIALAGASSTASVNMGAGTLTIDNTGTDTYAGTISGTGGITKTNTGTEILSGSGNNYSGNTSVTSGTLQLGAAGVIPDASPLVLNGGTFKTGAVAGFSETMATLNLSANSTIALGTGNHTIIFANSSGVSWAGNQLIVTGWTGTYGGGTSGAAGKIFVGSTATGLTSLQLTKIQFFNGTNYFPATQLSTGEVVPTGNIALYWGGTSSQSWTSNTWSTIDGGPYTQTWTAGTSAIFNVASSVITYVTTTNVGSITANESVTVTPAGTFTTGGTVAPIYVANGKIFDFSSQSFSTMAGTGIIKNGPGTLIGANPNAYPGGFTLNDGLMVVGSTNAMGASGALNLNGGTLGTSGARNITSRYTGINVGGDLTIGAAGYISTFTFADNVSLGNSTTRTITLGAAALQTFNGIISGTGSNLILNATAAGTLLLGGANTYGGATTINGGTLAVTGTLPFTTAVTLANTAGAILNNNTTQTIASLSGGGTTGGNLVLTSGSLTIGDASNTIYSGLISGTGAVIKQGTGILALAHTANTYTGTTTITAGMLKLNPATTTATFASQIVLNGGTLSTTNITAATTFTSSATLNLNAGSSIDLGANVHSLKFANSSANGWNAAASLVINGWTGTAGASGTAGKIYFGAANNTLTAGQLSQISFNGFPGAVAMLLATGELVPSPAINYTWTGASNSLWTTATNWSPNGIPTGSDNIIINSPGTNSLVIGTNQSIYDITLGGTGTLTLFSTGILNVYGSFTSTSSAAIPLYADCACTVNFASVGAQTIPALSYGNLNTSGGNRTLAAFGTIKICGSFTPGAGTFVTTGSTISFNGNTAQTVPSFTTSPVTDGYKGLVVENIGATVNAGAALTVSGALMVNANARLDLGANTLTLTGSTSVVTGFLRSGGLITGASTSTLTFSSSGTYEHNFTTSGTIPTASWTSGTPGATCAIIGALNNAPSGLGQSFYNLTWNSGQTASIGLNAAITTIRGSFTILSTGGANELRLTSSSSNAALTIGKDLVLTGGNLVLTSGSGNSTIDLAGSFTINGGTLSKTGSGIGLVNFSGTANQSITIPVHDNITNAISFRVNNTMGITIPNGSTLPINGNATFFRTNGAITLAGTGNISYLASSSNLTYDPTGTTAITTTDAEWPNTGNPTNVTISNSSSVAVTLHAARTLSGNSANLALTLTAGRLALGNFSLTISNNATASVVQTAGYLETTGTGSLVRTILSSTNNIYLFPVGNGANYTPVSYNFAANSLPGRQLSVRVVAATHPQMNNPAAPASYITNRYWVTSLNDAGGTYTYTPVYTYITAPADVVGTIGDIRISRWNGTVWSNTTNSSATGATLTTATVLSQTTGNLDAAQWTGRVVKPPVTYIWTLGAGGPWTTAANWTPNGIPTTPDIVQFTHNGNYTVTNVPTDITLSAMAFNGGGTTTLTVANAGSVNIGGGANPVLTVAAGTNMIVSGNLASDWTILTGSTGSVLGNIRLRGVSSNTAHTLQAEDAGGLVFGSGSYFAEGVLNTTNYSGNPFGSIGTANTVIFQNGSTFEQFDGGSPFGLNQPLSKVVFNSGSLFKYSENNASPVAFPSFTGRSFANFEYNSTQNKSVSGSSPFSADNFTVTQGTLNVNLDAAASSIKGNIAIAPGTALNINPATGGSINLNGALVQTISGTGALTLGVNATVNVTNSTGVTLQKNMTQNGNMTVASGAIFNVTVENAVTGSGSFTLQAGGTLGVGSVNGINSAGATGNIQTTTRGYSSLANYTYLGIASQATGNFNTTPTANTVNTMTVANTGTNPTDIVTLTSNNTTANTLNLFGGRFAAGTGQTLRIAAGGVVNGNGYLTNLGNQYIADAAGGTIEFTGNGAVRGTPALYNITIGNSGGGVDFTDNATIYNNFQVNNLGVVNPNAPKYAPGSTLVYNPGGAYNRSIEWGQLTALAAGYPHHVIVQNGTTLNLAVPSTPPGLETGGDLIIGYGTQNGIVDMNAATVPLKVNGNLLIGNAGVGSSQLKLSTVSGGDLWLYGSFTRYSSNSYNDNDRAIYLKGTADVTVNTPGVAITPGVPTQYFSYARIDKNTGAEQITLNCPVGITQEITFNKGIVNSNTANLLTITAPSAGSLIGGSLNSYVNGHLRRYTSTSTAGNYFFPIGDYTSSRYKPVTLSTINNLASGSDFTARYNYTASPTAGLDFFLTYLYAIQKNEYWQFDRNNGATTGKLTLPYADPGNTNWRDAIGNTIGPCPDCNVAIVKRSTSSGAGNWDFTPSPQPVNFATTTNPPEARYYTDNGDIITSEVSSFSPFSFGLGYNQILPVMLTSFAGKLSGNDGELFWQVANANGVAAFELQHSRNGRSFSKLADIKPGTLNAYQYLDPQLSMGSHFYRLLVKEKGGKTFYSQVVLLTVGTMATQIIGLMNNPVGIDITPLIFSASAQSVIATITDATGRLMMVQAGQLLQGRNQWKIPASGLPSNGLYLITINTSDGVQAALRFIKH